MGVVRKTLLRLYGVDPAEMEDTVEDLDARIKARARTREKAEERREQKVNEARREMLAMQKSLMRRKGGRP